MTEKDYFNRCPECGEARMDQMWQSHIVSG